VDADIAKFFYELGQLKRVRRSGWWVAGIDDPESVAEHTFRAAAIAFVIAEMEGANAEKAATLAIFHDLAESRVNDQHHLGKSYVETGDGESRAVDDQTRGLPQKVAERIRGLWRETGEKSSVEARIAKDADRLECLIQAREYEARGYVATGEWIETARATLVTETAKSIARACLSTDPASWWRQE